MATNALLFAFGLTLLAGLSTGIGGLFAYFAKRTNTKLLSVALGFSAGVMIYVSMVDLYGQSRTYLVTSMGLLRGSWLSVAAFFGGVFLIAVIDRFIPSYENPHELHKIEELDESTIKLLRSGILTALAIAIHNFPEGLATFTAALKHPTIGIAIAFAIAIHNIPEGISISIPVYYSTNSREKALLYSLLSGLAEPFGALIGYLILMPFLNDIVFGVLFAVIAGIMVFISLDELLPTAREYGEHHLSMYGLIAGMIVMAVSLQLFI